MNVHPVLERRAIREEFVSGSWGERYVAFKCGDWDGFKAGHSHPESWHKSSIVNRTGGIIVNRYGLDGARLHSYVRPEYAVWLRGHTKPSKYIYASGTRFPGEAKRLDVHPLVRERLLANTREPVYLSIEGCLKADAIAGTGRLAISVPSVTMWNLAPERLESWLPVLRRAPVVYVVPDSDYHVKTLAYQPGRKPVFSNDGQVRFHTDRCAIAFRRTHGVRIQYLVPPYLDRDEAIARRVKLKDRWKVGIDDHIYWQRNLDRWDEQSNRDGVHIFEYARGEYRSIPPRQRASRPADERDLAFLNHLEETRGPVGLFSMSDVADELGRSRRTVYDARRSCEQLGLIRVWPGNPLGAGRGNKPHVYRLAPLPAQDEDQDQKAA